MSPLQQCLADMLAAAQATYQTYHTAHWRVRGAGYYGKHQLLERLYNDAAEYFDQLAERAVGLGGVETVTLMDQHERIGEYLRELSETKDPLRRSLEAASVFRDVLSQCYETIDKDGSMTLGLDDLIMATASKVEEHMYLLQQSLDERQANRRARRGRRRR